MKVATTTDTASRAAQRAIGRHASPARREATSASNAIQSANATALRDPE